MKQYKLLGWPELEAPFHRTAHRRMLHRLSQGFVSAPELMQQSGLGRGPVSRFLDMLGERGLLVENHAQRTASGLGRLRPIAWLRRTLTGHGVA